MVVKERRHDDGHKAEGDDIQQAVLVVYNQENGDDKHGDERDEEHHAPLAVEYLFAQQADEEIERKHEVPPTNSPIKKYKQANYNYFNQKESEDADFVNKKKEWIKEIIENGK